MVILWRHLLSATAALASIEVATSELDAPIYLTVRNPVLWTALIRWISSSEVSQPSLAPGTELTLTREGSGVEQHVWLSVKVPDELTK